MEKYIYMHKITYKDYEDIPLNMVDYFLSVSDADNIYDIPLDEINEFIYLLESNPNDENT